jgi:hypothetical protein
MEGKRKLYRKLHDIAESGDARLDLALEVFENRETSLRFLQDLESIRKHSVQNKKTQISYDVVRPIGPVQTGDSISLLKVLNKVFRQRTGEQFSVGSVYASSRGAMEATDTGFLRVFYVGQVVQLRNEDVKYKDYWHVLITELYEPSHSEPKIIGKGVWLWGPEEVSCLPGSRGFKLEDPRELMISDYEFEVRSDCIHDVCRAFPPFLDSGRDDDCFFSKFFDYRSRTTHSIKQPLKEEHRDFGRVLCVFRSIALRANPVSSLQLIAYLCFVCSVTC